MTITGRRARSIEELREIQAPMSTPEGRATGLALKLRPTDVVVSPFGKSGTTWTQQIVHGLRTRGDMDFDDISRVVPWIEMSTDLGIDLDAEQRAEPRAFKSHLGWDDVPKGGRYIVPFRDPGDALVSSYHFSQGWFVEPGAISIETHARENFMNPRPGGGYWNHLRSWWGQRDNPEVLLMAYEQMKDDLDGTIRRIAAFIGVPLDGGLFEIVQRQSSLAFMTEYKDRFDDFLMRRRSEEVCGLPPGSDSAKVREGAVGARKAELPAEIQDELDARWTQDLTPHIGFASYAELLEEMRRRWAAAA